MVQIFPYHQHSITFCVLAAVLMSTALFVPPWQQSAWANKGKSSKNILQGNTM
jgi:hypothetical protein